MKMLVGLQKSPGKGIEHKEIVGDKWKEMLEKQQTSSGQRI